MSRLLYKGGNIAIVRQSGKRDQKHMLKELIAFDPDKPVSDALIEQLGEYALPESILLKDSEASSIDTSILSKYGFKLSPIGGKENHSNLYALDVADGRNQQDISISISEIRNAANTARYLCLLYLISIGHEDKDSLIFDIQIDNSKEFFEVADEYDLASMLSCKSKVPQRFKPHLDLPFQEIGSHKILELDNQGYLIVEWDIKIPWVAYEAICNGNMSSLEACAARILTNLLVSMTDTKYYLDFDYRAKRQVLKKKARINFFELVGEAIANGQIRACPHCNKPVYCHAESSRKFCSISHQNKYLKRAKEAVEHGMSVSEAVEKFPAVKSEKTISEWTKAV